ncbi:hypothetical protein EV183_001451 [Coemansia sp. RSA 2336]|nr:hypothetical protein EV183_001451 [Coemansia sp. RSA 2336]
MERASYMQQIMANRNDEVGSSTKSCYSSRIALWMHYCNMYCNGDDRINSQRLADYVEWLVSSGAAERIRQGATHIQQVLRNQLQGVMCYYRIQNKHNDRAHDPRIDPLFADRWQEIVSRYPRPRHARRTEPIYKSHRVTPPLQSSMDPRSHMPGPAVHGYMPNGSPSHGQGVDMRHPRSMPNGMPMHPNAPAPANPGISAMPGRPRHHPDPTYMGYPQPMPRHPYMSGPAYESRPVPAGAHPYAKGGNSVYTKDMPQHPRKLTPSAEYQRRSSISSVSQPLAPIKDSNMPIEHVASQQPALTSDKLNAAAMANGNRSDTTQPSRAASAGVMSHSDVAFASMPGSPKAIADKKHVRSGRVPAKMPEWEGEVANASLDAPEGHLLNSHEAQALAIGLLGAKESSQTQLLAHCMFGLAMWIPASARSMLTLADLSMDDDLFLEDKSVYSNMADEHTNSGSPTALSVTLRSIDNASMPAAKPGKAVALRHVNPLLCAWGSLAMCLFTRWHVSNEATPDFSTAEWQKQLLFPGVTANSDTDFHQLISGALSQVSNDKIDGAQIISDAGFFYADAFGLVKPTVSGIKGSGAVDAVDANTLSPDVLLAISRVNAGRGADVSLGLKSSKRFSVAPPQSLLKEVFPWLKTVLIDAFRQNTNNNDVQVARRILQVLRELRIILLQDVAFLLEIPALSEVVMANKLFEHELFKTPEFAAYREEMKRAVGADEIEAADKMCTSALEWVSQRKEKLPEGNADRMKPTAPILKSPISAPALPKSTALETDGELKRDRDTNGTDSQENLAEDLQSGLSLKRIRRENEPVSNGRIFDNVPTSSKTASPPSATQEPGQAEAALDKPTKALNVLQSENESLKAQMRRLEWIVNQNRAEVHAWMGRIEKSIRDGFSKSSEQPQGYYPGPAVPGHPGMHGQSAAPPRSHATPHMSAVNSESSPQAPRYYGGQYSGSAPQGNPRSMGPPSSGRNGMAAYDRPLHAATEYNRPAESATPPLPGQAYGAQMPPEADARYAGQPNGTAHASGAPYEHAEHQWYAKNYDSAYSSGHPPMRGAYRPGPY